jgi:tRNA/tmRNA/rRNA uracil-C5-methylase (TrmA/RlmC/RlmD family)
VKPAVGDRLDLEVTKVVHGGYGLARHEGFVLFVKGTLPGEQVAVQVSDMKKNHGYADLTDVREPSPHRREHIWPEADYQRPIAHRVGGADYGHIEWAHQRELKTEILRDALVCFGRFDEAQASAVTIDALPGDETGLGWRTRTTLHVSDQGVAGPYAEGTHQVVPVTTLPLSTPESEQLGLHRQDFAGHSRIRITHPRVSQPRIIIDNQAPEPISEWVGEIPFQLTDQTFWQVHTHAAQTLFDTVAAFVAESSPNIDAVHWDLYGGVGLFGRALIETIGTTARVVTVESDSDASHYAGVNLAEYPRAKAVHASTETFLRAEPSEDSSGPLGVVVLDPPRSGAKEEVVMRVCERGPDAVIYVACDPVALGRDLGLFRDRGYVATSVTGLDLFPHTHHFETVVRLARDNS